jgi:hypothetical protein
MAHIDWSKYRIVRQQMSDIVAPGTVKAATANCERDDCRISCKLRMTTLSAGSLSYDKDGSLLVDDHNERSTDVVCSRCWRGWEVFQKGDVITDVVEIIDPPPPPGCVAACKL